MRVPGLLLYIVGLVAVVAAVWLLFFESGLDRWLPAGVVFFIMLLILGVGLLAGAERIRGRREVGP